MTETQLKPTHPVPAERAEGSGDALHRRAVYSLPIEVLICLGRKRLSLAEVLKLQVDTILPLDVRIDDPLHMIVDDKIIARCELIEIDDGQLAVKITDIMDSHEN